MSVDECSERAASRAREKTPAMSAEKCLVESFLEGLRTGDRQLILSCVADDITGELPGIRTLNGKAAFDQEIENGAFEGHRGLRVTPLIEADDVVVAMGTAELGMAEGGPLEALICAVFYLSAGKIQRLVSYQVETA